MDIYITENNSQSGPYSEAQIQEMMTAGMLSEKDAGWHEGLSEWIALGQIVKGVAQQPIDPVPPPFVGIFQISKGLFRILVGLSILLILFQILSGYVLSLPEPLETYDNTRYNSPSPAFAIFFLLSFVTLIGLLIASYVGLFLIHKWGRLLFTITAGFAVFVTLCLGPDVETALSNAFGSLFDMTNGAILALAYFTPLFDRGLRARK
jgi:hypothetical protein